MIITKQNLIESGIKSLTFNANIMKDADGNKIADVMDQALKMQSASNEGFQLLNGKRKTDAEFFVQNDGWFVKIEYAYKTNGEKVINKADLMFSILDKDLLTLAKADPKFASGNLYAFEVSKFPDPVAAQISMQPYAQASVQSKVATPQPMPTPPKPIVAMTPSVSTNSTSAVLPTPSSTGQQNMRSAPDSLSVPSYDSLQTQVYTMRNSKFLPILNRYFLNSKTNVTGAAEVAIDSAGKVTSVDVTLTPNNSACKAELTAVVKKTTFKVKTTDTSEETGSSIEGESVIIQLPIIYSVK